VSPWAIGAAAFAWLVGLAIALPNPRVALELWLLTVATAALIRYGRRRSPRSVRVEPGSGASPDTGSGWGTGLPDALVGMLVWTDDEVATALRVDREAVVTAIRNGTLPGNQIDGAWRIRSDALLAWLDGRYLRSP
jgi:hypothetical protein